MALFALYEQDSLCLCFPFHIPYGRVNIWRAIFGSEPNEDIYDINEHVPIDTPETWMYDNIYDISTAADYDFEDIFVIQADESGILTVELEPITTGENLDMEILKIYLLKTNLLILLSVIV